MRHDEARALPRASFTIAALALGTLAACARFHASPSAPHVAGRSRGAEVGWTPSACFAARADADADGMDDGCELALAGAFAPRLLTDSRDCLSDPAARGGGDSPALRGEYLFAAQRVRDAAAVRLAYLMAYDRDCGWPSRLACGVVRRAPCSEHAGDSEAILIDVVPDGDSSARWAASAIFLSAHCFGSGTDCRWYRGEELGAFTWADADEGAAPQVWVSRGKHANYPSRAACEAGHWSRDSCAPNLLPMTFPVTSQLYNVGSANVPFAWRDGRDCVSAVRSRVPPSARDSAAAECLWTHRPFRGWQPPRVPGASTAYSRYLVEVAEFVRP